MHGDATRPSPGRITFIARAPVSPTGRQSIRASQALSQPANGPSGDGLAQCQSPLPQPAMEDCCFRVTHKLCIAAASTRTVSRSWANAEESAMITLVEFSRISPLADQAHESSF